MHDQDSQHTGSPGWEEPQFRPDHNYSIAVGDQSLTFRPATLADPMPLGRQILQAAGHQDVDEFSLYAILPEGDFEDVRLDETYDLRGKGVERFLFFRLDREFRLTLDGRELRWGEPVIAGYALYKLAKIADDDQAIYLDVRGGEDRLIERDDRLDLTQSGVERLVTATRKYEIVVNSRPKIVTGRIVTFKQVVEFAFPGVPGANTVFDVTYRHAASSPPSGELGVGGTIHIKQGTTFNVHRTVQS